jgi:hypothetical protein
MTLPSDQTLLADRRRLKRVTSRRLRALFGGAVGVIIINVGLSSSLSTMLGWSNEVAMLVSGASWMLFALVVLWVQRPALSSPDLQQPLSTPAPAVLERQHAPPVPSQATSDAIGASPPERQPALH